MEITLIQEGTRTVIDANLVQLESEIIDVTAFADSWRNYVPSGIRTLTVEGKTLAGDEIEATFALEDVIDHRTYIVGSRLE